MKRFISLFLVFAMCICCPVAGADLQRVFSVEETLALELKELGIFKGVSEAEFELDRAPSRVEAIVMLIRVLGKENEALTGKWQHPFTDVPEWAEAYVGYAYSNGLTKGESELLFGTGDANAPMYLTFVLRALGYSDTNGEDFTWDNPYALSEKTGILTADVNINAFLRADVVLVSHAALGVHLKNSGQTLAEKLILANVFSRETFERIYTGKKIPENTGAKTEMNAEEIYAKCSPAVFYVEVYDQSGDAYACGSGFFIDDKGTAVTNYHVLKGCFSAKAQMSDTKVFYDILGIYDYSEENDWAVIQVDCTGNKYLSFGDVSSIKGGETIFTIGSPKGLQNTISDGLISNPKRVFEGEYTEYIQISAPFSNGSSGGAMLNKYGEVLGITSAIMLDAQNLNLVIPVTYLQGYSHGELKSFEQVFYGHSLELEEALKSGDRQKAAFTMLKWIIINNHKVKSPERGYLYQVSMEKYGGREYQMITLSYQPESNVVMAHILEIAPGVAAMEYEFDITYGAEETTATYWFFEYAEEDYKEIWQGKAKVPIKEFSPDSAYIFDGHTDDGDESWQVLEEDAKLMHASVLVFIETEFKLYAEAFGLYTVEDLGYSAFASGITKGNAATEKSNITYKLSTQGVTVKEGETVTVEMDYVTKGFPADVDFYLASESEKIATAEWAPDDKTLPWEIIITGVSEGTTHLTIKNDFNDQTVSIPIKVTAQETDDMYTRMASAAFPLRLYSNDGVVYLGKLTTNNRDEEGILNPYSKYGNQTSVHSIFNTHYKYGDRRSEESAFYEYATKPPVIVDNDGNFIAYLTNNTELKFGLSYAKLLTYMNVFRM